MRAIGLAVLMALFLASALTGRALAEETRYYNEKGQYVGKRDASGRIYDAKGRVQGWKDTQGRYYDDKGRYRGKEARDTTPVNTTARKTKF